MKLSFLLFVCVFAGHGQVGPSAMREPAGANLPMQTIGANDLLSISVYDAPELTRSVRVSADGLIRLPLLPRKIQAQGSMPPELEESITTALKEEGVLVDPVVTVTIAEYHSRPISVMGAVKKPLTFQASAPTTLLDALARAEGLTADAGAVILVSRLERPGEPAAATDVHRITVSSLIDGANPKMNLTLTGGEQILIPTMGRVFVVGTVRRPGAFTLREDGAGTVLQMVALAEGLAPYAAKTAYIYRRGTNGVRREEAVQLEEILKRKQADVTVLPDDILYVPDNKTKRLTITAVERLLNFGSTAGATALIYR
ncbi:MAG TPA: polysaccharide biosynthesis/export family protein [Bryobacteraceae bacterium]|jgi:polysaccharide export outer membrane protein|nr:polysaccharide biosynthesis/export family protein [Bryobacteraceae bacterium]